jgi:tRNA (guanine-N7-)-methyltransferase
MRPKQLKTPFRWNDRKPLLEDRVLYVPEYYQEHQSFSLPELSDPRLFGRVAPTLIEYCSGNGDWIIEKALQLPHFNWLAVEKRFDRVRKIWSKLKNHQVDNLVIVCGEAEPFTQYYLKEGCIEGCFINFPDPWPKGKHAKHRLFQSTFIQQLHRVMQPSGKATIATDDLEWANRISHALLREGIFQPVFPQPYYVTQWENYGSSYFEQLWLSRGKTIHYLQFLKWTQTS